MQALLLSGELCIMPFLGGQLRLLETELSRSAAQRDLLKRVARSAEAQQHMEEEKAVEIETTSKVNHRGRRKNGRFIRCGSRALKRYLSWPLLSILATHSIRR